MNLKSKLLSSITKLDVNTGKIDSRSNLEILAEVILKN